MEWTFNDGKRSWSLLERYGVVSDVQRWSDTHITGAVTVGTQYTPPSASIRSQSVDRANVFVKFNNGEEAFIPLDNWLQVRSGSRVREIRMFGHNPEIVDIENLDTGERWTHPDLLKKGERFPAVFSFIAIAAVSYLIFASVGDGFSYVVDRYHRGTVPLWGLLLLGSIPILAALPPFGLWFWWSRFRHRTRHAADASVDAFWRLYEQTRQRHAVG